MYFSLSLFFSPPLHPFLYKRYFSRLCRQRPYHVESTGSRPITEVKQRRARLVLGWVTAWEHRVLLATFFSFFFCLLTDSPLIFCFFFLFFSPGSLSFPFSSHAFYRCCFQFFLSSTHELKNTHIFGYAMRSSVVFECIFSFFSLSLSVALFISSFYLAVCCCCCFLLLLFLLLLFFFMGGGGNLPLHFF